MVSDSTLHALLGAVVTVVLSFIPFSPVLGGGVAAYLNEADANAGLRVGAISGLLAAIPLVLFGLLAVFFLGFFAFGLHGGSALGIGGLLVVLVGGAVAVAYTVGLSALGGYLGSYLVDGV
ncbi:DUF5518 domain-containing protein [Haloplanus pelagicus]|jgi:ABC-type phosphate transport system permease subunit|uniref:DUF5518 domain-containing protein n=1 Tax=Haloplanus pelagicus TaxID=2949995 RepID=UPI0020423C03|nr:DUF5518 domain-containing protein [Haloplanus sp. HW8-1]